MEACGALALNLRRVHCCMHRDFGISCWVDKNPDVAMETGRGALRSASALRWVLAPAAEASHCGARRPRPARKRSAPKSVCGGLWSRQRLFEAGKSDGCDAPRVL